MDGCIQGTICFEWMKGVPAAFVTFVIGCIAARITYNQFRVAQAKLKLDLFDKRFKIFHETWKIVSLTVANGTREERYGLGTPFNNFLPEAKFLFGKEVYVYLDEVSTKWARLHGIEGMERPSEYAQERFDLLTYFHDQADKRVKEVFGPYLNFDEWK
jgi:hypothetical protein